MLDIIFKQILLTVNKGPIYKYWPNTKKQHRIYSIHGKMLSLPKSTTRQNRIYVMLS